MIMWLRIALRRELPRPGSDPTSHIQYLAGVSEIAIFVNHQKIAPLKARRSAGGTTGIPAVRAHQHVDIFQKCFSTHWPA